jgi:anti-sigma-K factor RskA
MPRDHARYQGDLAPYLLRALPPIEAEELEAHLRTCAECRRELERLRLGTDALARGVEPVEPPPSLRERLVEQVRRDKGAPGAEAASPESEPSIAAGAEEHIGVSGPRRPERRRRQWMLAFRPRRLVPALARVALVAVLAGLVGSSLAFRSIPRERTVAAVIDHGRLPGAGGRLTVMPGGRTAVLHLTGLPSLGPRETYELWVARDGDVSPGPLFNPSSGGSALTGVSGDVHSMDAVLVTRERAGGARTPTEQPVVRVPLS